MIPPHFYGELSKTDNGYQRLYDSQHCSRFAGLIRESNIESLNSTELEELKAALWAMVRF